MSRLQMIPKCVDLATSREALNNRVRLLFQVDVCIQIKFIFLKSLTTCHLAGGLVVTLYLCVPEPDSVGLPCLRLLCMKCGLLVDRLSMVSKWSKGTRGLTGFLHESTELQRSSSEKNFEVNREETQQLYWITPKWTLGHTQRWLRLKRTADNTLKLRPYI